MPSPDHFAFPRITRPVKIVSWLGGEHWYIGNREFLHLEDAIAHCDRLHLAYEIVTAHLYKSEGD
ncbi:MAG TPA: hypothetical protein VL126_07740 [Bacteroidota bacterium]|nr:hypothetical protein [Bacteroidota bacterium]